MQVLEGGDSAAGGNEPLLAKEERVNESIRSEYAVAAAFVAAIGAVVFGYTLGFTSREGFRHQPNPPLWALGEMHQPILGLDTAPRPLRLMIWT